ncbi:MAG: type VI secretion protein [Gammaproteobacteria bacterium]|nr:type VI secretion protein [Gammaproteobacteria bacterium]MDH5262850.1 type VI secretion protein [Gammaproteobacteria bacterium]MDH5620656.1 type VI secretion protein [Gammaproteobacteria bacterium]
MLKYLMRRIRAALLVLTAMMQPLLADESAEIDSVNDCRAISGDAERLLCYDTVVDGGTFDQKQAEKENFGTSKSQPESAVEKLVVTIVRVQKSDSGIHYFHTADEQIWKQVNRGNWSLDVPVQAEIKSGLMGSFFLVTEGGKSTRVKRVQ